MVQLKTSRPPQPQKDTGDGFKSYEFTELNDVINSNSVDANERYLSTLSDLPFTQARANALDLAVPRTQSYNTTNLPLTADNGTIAYNTDTHTIIYHKNGLWYNVSNNTSL